MFLPAITWQSIFAVILMSVLLKIVTTVGATVANLDFFFAKYFADLFRTLEKMC